MATAAKITLDLKTKDTAEGAAATILANTEAQFGFAPNMYRAMANLPGVLEHYSATYTAFRETAGFTPAEQETVFLAISQANGCHYCTAAHSMIADTMSGVPAEALAALRAGRDPADPKLGALARFARKMTTARGVMTQADINAFLAAGFTERHVLGVVMAVACKVFSNYTNHLFQTPIDAAFAGHALAEDTEADTAA